MSSVVSWADTLKTKVLYDGNLDEKYANGVYDMALDMTEEIYEIFANNNDLNDIADAYFPDTEIACYIYDAIKYGKIKSSNIIED